jgi:hypothetical protein
MNATIRWAGAALFALAAPVALAANAVEPDPKAAAGKPDVDLSETDMSHTGKTPGGGTVTVPWSLLGGAVGNRTVNGVRVELFVLQAQDLDKLKPGDPNHAFTVTLKDDKSSELLKQGEVSLAVAGAGPLRPTAMSSRSSGVYRSGVALPKPGEYRITIAFTSAGKSGQAEFPYVFRPDAQSMPTHHH